MFLIIGGHPRSGTTLLRILCNSHAEMMVTMEFGCFNGLNRFYGSHLLWVLRRCWRKKRRNFLVDANQTQIETLLKNYLFAGRYLFALAKKRVWFIDETMLKNAFRESLPPHTIVGDKSAFYIFLLDTLVTVDNLKRLIIYRDCRAVTSSTLVKVRTEWRQMPWVTSLDTAAKIASQWVRAIELMEKHQAKLCCIRYEELVTRPRIVTEQLGQYLEVSPAGFPVDIIHADSIHHYQKGLTPTEMDSILAIAGPTMKRLGYL